MKHIIILFVFISFFSFSGCDPDNYQLETYHATIKGSLNNSKENLNLGDTLKYSLDWPDILKTENALGDTRTETVNSLQYAWYGYRIYRIDTINRKVYTTVGDSTKVFHFINPGFQRNPCLPCYTGFIWFRNNPKPYNCALNLIPRVKGVFYLEIIKQAGPFKVNNNFEGKFSATIDVPDKHLGLIDQYLPGFETAIIEAGMSVYCFRVK